MSSDTGSSPDDARVDEHDPDPIQREGCETDQESCPHARRDVEGGYSERVVLIVHTLIIVLPDSERLALILVYPRCSFCGAPPVAWYEGPDFVTSVPSPEEVRSEEAWLACGTCVRLVNEGDREALVLRAAHDSLMGIRENFDHGFWARRDGSP